MFVLVGYQHKLIVSVVFTTKAIATQAANNLGYNVVTDYVECECNAGNCLVVQCRLCGNIDDGCHLV